MDRRLTRIGLVTGSLLAAVAGSAAWGQVNAPSALEQRIMAKLTADPELAATLGRPASQMSKIASLVGNWEVKSSRTAQYGIGTSVVTPVFGGNWLEMRGAAPGGMQNITFIGFNPGMRKWQFVSIDNLGNSSTVQGDDWNGDRLILEGDIVALGVQAHVRQTIIRLSDDAYRVIGEERIDGAWQPIDEHLYTREAR